MMGKGILSLQEGGPNDDDPFKRFLDEIFGDNDKIKKDYQRWLDRAERTPQGELMFRLNEGTPVGGYVDVGDIAGTPEMVARRNRIDELRARLREMVKTVQRQNLDAFDSDLNRPGYLESVSEIRAGTDAAMPTWWDKVTGSGRWKSERLQQMIQWLDDMASLGGLGLSPEHLKEVFGPDSPFPERFPMDVEDLSDSNLRAFDQVEAEEMSPIAQTSERMFEEYEEYAELLDEMRGENPIAGTVADRKEYPLEFDPVTTDDLKLHFDSHGKRIEEIDPLTGKPLSPHERFLSKYADWPSMKKIMSMVPLSALAGALSPLDALEIAATPVALGSGDVPREQPRVPTVMERMSQEEEQLINRLVPATTSRALEGIMGGVPQRPRTPVLRRSFRR